MKKITILFVLFCSIASIALAQKPTINPQDTVPIRLFEKKFNESYERNIKKSRINGVYIPANLEEAHEELKALSQASSLEKFKSAEKFFVVDRLHYGLGRWMILNWNFYDGSRYSHFLKSLGVHHPDDMARFTLLTLHDVLNNIEPDIEVTVEKLVSERALLNAEKKQRN